jgi:hypothetical protein
MSPATLVEGDALHAVAAASPIAEKRRYGYAPKGNGQHPVELVNKASTSLATAWEPLARARWHRHKRSKSGSNPQNDRRIGQEWQETWVKAAALPSAARHPPASSSAHIYLEGKGILQRTIVVRCRILTLR